MQRAADVALDRDVDHAAHVAAVPDAEAARVEVDLVDQVGREHRRSGQEVVQHRDRLAADEHAGVGWVGAAHDQQAEAERRAGDARHVLQHAQRIAERAGDRGQLGAGQRLLRLLRVLGAGAHARLVEAARALRRVAAPLDRGRTGELARGEVADARFVGRVGDDHAQRPGVADADLEAAVVVGRADHLGLSVGGPRCRPAANEGDVGGDDGLARAALADLTAHDDACGRRGNRRRRLSRGVGRRRVRAGGIGRYAAVGSFGRVSHLGLEMDRVRDANRRGLAVDLGREELHLAGRGGGCLIEAVSRRCRDGNRGHVTVRGNIDRQGDVAGDAAVQRLRRVNRLDRLLDGGGLGQLGGGPRSDRSVRSGGAGSGWSSCPAASVGNMAAASAQAAS